MKNVVDSLPKTMASIFIDLVAKNDQELLESFLREQEPTKVEREKVEMIFADEFVLCLDEDSEPTERGKAINNVLASFLATWPIEDE